jgi:uncharacterized membrane protein YagU involved in acid resistance
MKSKFMKKAIWKTAVKTIIENVIPVIIFMFLTFSRDQFNQSYYNEKLRNFIKIVGMWNIYVIPSKKCRISILDT